MDLFSIEIKYRPLISTLTRNLNDLIHNRKYSVRNIYIWSQSKNIVRHCPYCFLHLKITKNVIIAVTTPVNVY